MPGPEFFQTRMGQRFYETTMPDLVAELRRLNTNLEALRETIVGLGAQSARAQTVPINRREVHALSRSAIVRSIRPAASPPSEFKTACGLDAAFLVTSGSDDGVTCAECRDRLGLESKR